MRYINTAIVLGIALSIACQVDAQIDPETVVGVWMFETDPKDGVRDNSGNGHNGEVTGDVKWVQGKFGEALEFPGVSGNLVSIPHAPELNLFTSLS